MRIPPGPAERESLRRHMILLTSVIEVAAAIGQRGAAHIAPATGWISRKQRFLGTTSCAECTAANRLLRVTAGAVRARYHRPALPAALNCAARAAANAAPRELHVPVPMRDGVRLSANVFLPAEHARGFPPSWMRTPYGKGAEISRPTAGVRGARLRRGGGGRARPLRIRRRLRAAAPGSRRWRRHAQLDRRASHGPTARSA